MFNVWTGWGELLVFLSMVSFYLNFWIESRIATFDALYGIWEEFTTNVQAWLGLMLVLSCILTIDPMGKVVMNVFEHFVWKRALFEEEKVALKMVACNCEKEELFQIPVVHRRSSDRRDSKPRS